MLLEFSPSKNVFTPHGGQSRVGAFRVPSGWLFRRLFIYLWLSLDGSGPGGITLGRVGKSADLDLWNSRTRLVLYKYCLMHYRPTINNRPVKLSDKARVLQILSDKSRSLQSWVSTIQSVALTADAFQYLVYFSITTVVFFALKHHSSCTFPPLYLYGS